MILKEFDDKYQGKVTIFSGLIFISLGFLLWIYKSLIPEGFFWLLGSLIVLGGLINLIKFPFSIFKKNAKSLLTRLLDPIIQIVFGLIVSRFNVIPTLLIAIVIGVYFLLVGCVRLFNFVLLKKDHVKGYYRLLIDGWFFMVAGLGVLSITKKADDIYTIVGIYLIYLGLTNIRDTFSYKTIKDGAKIKRKKRANLPVIFAALVPTKLLQQYNDFREKHRDIVKKAVISKIPDKVDLEIWIHTSSTMGFDAVGHVDISFNGLTYSYGNYNVDSLKLFGTLGEGILWKMPTSEYQEWIKTIENRAVFRYGMDISEYQIQQVQQYLDDLMKNTVEMELVSETQKQSYLGKLSGNYQDVKLYRFVKSRYKTYFVLTTNCALLAESILGKTGIDLINSGGISAPGTYLDYFERQYHRPHSQVVSKSIFAHGELVTLDGQ